MPQKFALGMLGLGVMGRSLAQNFQRNGFKPIGYDISPNLPKDFPVKTTSSLETLVNSLETPRIFILMIPAGNTIDKAIESLLPLIDKGDIIVDGGNSFFEDTNRRVRGLADQGIHFIGMGVSGGEEGALWGPSLMPGGSVGAWDRVRPMFEAISAKAKDGEPCAAWMGNGGSGHFVKMVHNGIEYADMQLIAETYDLLHRGAGLSNQVIAGIFGEWNKGKLNSYLIEITAKILAKIDLETGNSLVDMILDSAAQKGTGLWTSLSALEIGTAIPTIQSSVEARLISGLKTERIAAAKVLGKAHYYIGNSEELIAAAAHALFANKISAYAQGINLMQFASKAYQWNLTIERIVRVWRAGCIIQAELLNDIAAAYNTEPDLSNLLLNDAIKREILERQEPWRKVIATAIQLGIPMPAASASLAYFDAYRSTVLPANLIQAQRDYFGAHTYQRVDMEGNFHTDWN